MMFFSWPLFATGRGFRSYCGSGIKRWLAAYPRTLGQSEASLRDSRGRLSLHQNLSRQRIFHIGERIGHYGHGCGVFAEFAGNYFVEGVGGGVMVVEIGSAVLKDAERWGLQHRTWR